MHINRQTVQRHYTRTGLLDAILGALQRTGKNLAHLVPDDLAPVDEFHTRGRPATVELAQLVGFTGSENVLDVGSGLGGPARFLAGTYGCHVTGIDLTQDFVAVAEKLTQLTGLSDRIGFQQGDALALPFAAATFDVVWSQNVAMNIADRRLLYAEIARVLRAGGRYALSDVVAGDGGEPCFPMPWAHEARGSHLLTEEDTRQMLESAGFRLIAWENTTARAAAAAMERAAIASPAPLGLHLLFGADWPVISANLLRNYRVRTIGVVQGVARKN